jgi:hypothetical protein
MRQWVVVVGFFIIVLMVIAGCTSQNGAPSGSNSQNSAPRNPNVKMTSVVSHSTPSICKISTPDPIRFQKFFPDIPGWTKKYGQKIKNDDNYYYTSQPGNYAQMKEIYYQNPQDPQDPLAITITDNGPCSTQSIDEYLIMNTGWIGPGGEPHPPTLLNFHGYRAAKNTQFNTSFNTRGESLYIGINNRLRVQIVSGGDTEPEADARIETIANAIDFTGLATLG